MRKTLSGSRLLTRALELGVMSSVHLQCSLFFGLRFRTVRPFNDAKYTQDRLLFYLRLPRKLARISNLSLLGRKGIASKLWSPRTRSTRHCRRYYFPIPSAVVEIQVLAGRVRNSNHSPVNFIDQP